MKDLVGYKFGRLTVIKKVGKDKNSKYLWECICDCGNKESIIVIGQNLKNGNTKSCGCLQKETISKLNKKYNKYQLNNNQYYIGYINNEKSFILDKEDYNLVSKYNWLKNKSGYIRTNINNKEIFLHRLVLGVHDIKNKDIIVDHINHKLYDCRKINLRIVDGHKSQMNRGLALNNTSGVTGVGWDLRNNQWRARISVNYKEILLGYFDNFEDAVEARKEAEEKYQKEYSYDNSIQSLLSNEIIL